MKLKTGLRLGLTNLLVMSVAVLALEGAFRIRGHTPYPGAPPDVSIQPSGHFFQADSLLGYRHIQGSFDVTLDRALRFQVNHDAHSLRVTKSKELASREVNPEIWVFGCSFTHGWSVNDEESYPWKIQSELKDYNVVNWGVTGYGTLQFYLQLKNALEHRPKPAVVILNHASFHHQRNILSKARQRALCRWNYLGEVTMPHASLDENGDLEITYLPISFEPWTLSEISAMFNYIERNLDLVLESKNQRANEKITSAILKEIIDLCNVYGLEVVISNIYGNPEFLRKLCTNEAVPFADISLDLSQDGLSNKPHDGHASAKAHEMYAQKMSLFLSENGLLR